MELNGTIFLQIFIFLTLLLWLSRSLFAPVMKLFDERERRMIGAKELALELGARADQKARTFDIEYEKARTNARQTLTSMKNAMEKEQNEALERAKIQARARVEKALGELALEENQVRNQLMSASKNLADDLVETLLRRSA